MHENESVGVRVCLWCVRECVRLLVCLLVCLCTYVTDRRTDRDRQTDTGSQRHRQTEETCTPVPVCIVTTPVQQGGSQGPRGTNESGTEIYIQPAFHNAATQHVHWVLRHVYVNPHWRVKSVTLFISRNDTLSGENFRNDAARNFVKDGRPKSIASADDEYGGIFYTVTNSRLKISKSQTFSRRQMKAVQMQFKEISSEIFH